MSVLVNDVHSRLNATHTAAIQQPQNSNQLIEFVRNAARAGTAMSICGGRHAMGGQQFATDRLLLDMSAMRAVHSFDSVRGLIEIEAGADWPAIIDATHKCQTGEPQWGIRQKQTGADCLTLGGALAANVHGRGFLMRPIVDDIEAFTLVDARAQLVRCSRDENADLFSLVIGGYGLFGVVASVTLRLGRKVKLRRLVDVLDIDDALAAVRRRIAEGCIYGDFQYAIDATDDSFLRRGVCACYQPVEQGTPVSDSQSDLSEKDWLHLLRLAHEDKRCAFAEYASHYVKTHGQVYWSDTMQLSTYLPTYAEFLATTLRDDHVAESLVIGEQFVPPDSLVEFLGRARRILRKHEVEDIYGTIRLIQPESETVLAWARAQLACVIFNLRTPHDAQGIAKTGAAFRALNDAAIELGGGFYLTYQRFATREQVSAAYPRFSEFLAEKRRRDPRGVFTSDWYRHYAALFA